MKTLIQDNTILGKNRTETYLTAQATAGTGTLTVNSIVGFAINYILLIGELGEENCEIILTHSATAPTGTTITLASNLLFTHLPYTKIKIIPYNQIEFSHADTITGTKSVLTTIAVRPNALETIYNDTASLSGYFFTRFKETITNTFSDYSDPIPFEGLEQNTVGFAINYALKRNKLDGFTDWVDYQFCIEETNAALNFIAGKMKGWTKLFKENYIMGQTSRGVYKIALPTDIWESGGLKSIAGVRVGTATDLDPKNISEFEADMEGVCHTQVRTAAAIGDITLAIDNSYDFPDTGSVNIYVSGTIYTITYTGVTRSATAGVLTGVPASGDGSITVIIPVDTDVWYGEDEGEPEEFTVDDEKNLLIWPMADATYDNLNIYLDYYTGPTKVDSDADELDAFRYDAVKHWLTWAMRMQLKNDGIRDFNDGDYVQFAQIVSDYFRNELPSQRKKRQPKINSISFN
ncbi:MAG: hypothetical protein PHQ35_10800 [Phycisphaerae bacterium]|nr:hypothetical protein [Phycisphaerae bacterium]